MLGVFLLAIALWAAPTHVQAGDSGELATVMLRGGIPHPSGYPWMRIFGVFARLLEHLGVGPMRSAALTAAGVGVAGWLVLHRVALRLAGTGPGAAPAATFAIALPATSALVVSHGIDAEVWGPLVLFAGLVCHRACSAPTRPFQLGLVFGLAISHHLTASLLLPLVVFAAWPPGGKPSALARNAALGVAGGIVGLLPYLTLAVGTGGPWRWGDPSTFGGLLRHVSRADYGIFALSLHTESPPAGAQLSRVFTSLGRALSADLVAFGLGGAVILVVLCTLAVRRRPELVPRRVQLGISAAIVTSGVLFPLAHNIDPTSPFGAWILERFDILPLCLAALLLASVVGPLPSHIERRVVRLGLAGLAVILVLRQLVMTTLWGVPRDNVMIETYARDLLRTPPPDRPAIVIGTDDHRIFPVLFVQEVLGEGEQTLYVDASLLAHPWYRTYLRGRLPALPDVDQPLALIEAVWREPALADVPVYLSNDFSRSSTRLPRVPEGVLWRVLPPGELDVSADEVLRRHRAALSRYGRIPLATVRSGHPFASDLAATYTEGTGRLLQALRAEGRTAEADALSRDFAHRIGAIEIEP